MLERVERRYCKVQLLNCGHEITFVQVVIVHIARLCLDGTGNFKEYVERRPRTTHGQIEKS